MTISFEAYQAKSALLNETLKAASAKLDVFPTGPMGLTPDAVRALPAYQQASRTCNAAFQALRKFNGSISNDYKRRASQLRLAKKLAA